MSVYVVLLSVDVEDVRGAIERLRLRGERRGTRRSSTRAGWPHGIRVPGRERQAGSRAGPLPDPCRQDAIEIWHRSCERRLAGAEVAPCLAAVLLDWAIVYTRAFAEALFVHRARWTLLHVEIARKHLLGLFRCVICHACPSSPRHSGPMLAPSMLPPRSTSVCSQPSSRRLSQESKEEFYVLPTDWDPPRGAHVARKRRRSTW